MYLVRFLQRQPKGASRKVEGQRGCKELSIQLGLFLLAIPLCPASGDDEVLPS